MIEKLQALIDKIENEPLPTLEPATSVQLGRYQVAQEIRELCGRYFPKDPNVELPILQSDVWITHDGVTEKGFFDKEGFYREYYDDFAKIDDSTVTKWAYIDKPE